MTIYKDAIIKSKIAGTTFKNDDGSDRQQLIAKYVKPGTKIYFELEPKNPYDANAIKIYIFTKGFLGLFETKRQLGYVTSYLAESLAKYLHENGKVDAKVIEVTGKYPHGVNIEIKTLT